jgi:DNA helicase II / ATP-dependent DNA helicase PcrA
LDPPEATSGDARATQRDEEYVTIATIHWAKGGEWKIVRVLNVVEGCIPSSKATTTLDEIEEELRILHVAMTRAKDELELIVPQRLFMYQHNEQNSGYANSKVSRFVPRSIHHVFERKHWDHPGGEHPSSRSKWQSRRIDVASKAEAMWR